MKKSWLAWLLGCLLLLAACSAQNESAPLYVSGDSILIDTQAPYPPQTEGPRLQDRKAARRKLMAFYGMNRLKPRIFFWSIWIQERQAA